MAGTKKPPEERREERVTFLVTETALARMQAAAEADNVEIFSQWIRTTLLRRADELGIPRVVELTPPPAPIASKKKKRPR